MKKIKKGKIAVVITIAIACFALTTIMFMQFKIVNQTDVTSIEAMREEELRTELANWKDKYNEAEEQYQQKSEELAEYKEKEQSEVESSALVEKEQSQINLYLGKSDVEGEGIIITLNEYSSDEDVEPIGAEDLLVIVDYLRSAGAEAISINEERIINMTDIVYVNNSIIYVNQQRILAPYVIKAIGDETRLESVLLGTGGYVDELKKIGFDISITKENKIKIPKYNSDIGYKYIQ